VGKGRVGGEGVRRGGGREGGEGMRKKREKVGKEEAHPLFSPIPPV
jgi:hypothetical protein